MQETVLGLSLQRPKTPFALSLSILRSLAVLTLVQGRQSRKLETAEKAKPRHSNELELEDFQMRSYVASIATLNKTGRCLKRRCRLMQGGGPSGPTLPYSPSCSVSVSEHMGTTLSQELEKS